jgi:hypothetical protein
MGVLEIGDDPFLFIGDAQTPHLRHSVEKGIFGVTPFCYGKFIVSHIVTV